MLAESPRNDDYDNNNNNSGIASPRSNFSSLSSKYIFRLLYVRYVSLVEIHVSHNP